MQLDEAVCCSWIMNVVKPPPLTRWWLGLLCYWTTLLTFYIILQHSLKKFAAMAKSTEAMYEFTDA